MQPAESRTTSEGAKASVAARLAAVDWSFSQGRASTSLESLHPYPAKFVPQIPGTLLDLLPLPPGSHVVDPFVGSGTTLSECQRRGYPSVGVDINPIACLISRVRTSPYPVGLMDVARAVAEIADDGTPTDPNAIPNVDHWFRDDVQAKLSALTAAIDSAPDACRDALSLALSSIVVRVSNQESDTRYAAIKKDISGDDVLPLFSTSVAKLHMALRQRDYPLTEATVIEGDSRSVDVSLGGKPVGAIITSPPYPNAYEYWLYHKYRMYWLKKDPIAVREAEIGARPHFFKKNPHTAEHFRVQMAEVLGTATRTMARGGWLCVVVGRSRIHGKDVNNAHIVRDVASSLSFQQEAEVEREISPTRKSFNLAHARIKTESILVFSKS